MTHHAHPATVERFRALVARRLGLRFDESKGAFLDEVLAERAAVASVDVETYVAHLEPIRSSREELRAVAERLTVGETYFFRNADQFRAFTERVLPERARAQRSGPLRILSAGCATGEEPYSIAMLALDGAVGLPRSQWEIRAVDVNRASLEKARRGRYAPWALRETPADMRDRWFVQDGREFVLADAVRASVTFEERNLAELDPALWTPQHYDVIFFRNVVMYFTPEVMQSVIAAAARALVPGGFLFLGHAETLRGLTQDFALCHTHETFYYRLKSPSERDATPADAAPFAMMTDAGSAPLAAIIAESTSWVDAIQRASERIRTLSSPPDETTAPATTGSAALPAAGDLGPAREFMRSERFGDALEALGALPLDAASAAEALLLKAAILTQRGAFLEAEAICAELLARDEMNAGAHYLLALCREGAGDLPGARDHDQVAAYLDPAFAMPRLHLGLLARRTGDVEAAKRELALALALLEREEPSRILLFGGGFGAAALAAVCRSGLRACGAVA